tara:strand:- start:2868 stop:4892 length:2025 start_codon:yes stop_codon:yes gene_type:complete
MARRLTESEQQEVIDYMRNIRAPEGGANYVDEGERMLMDPSIYRTLPLVEQNFETFPIEFQDQVIRGGRARDEQKFMGASGGQLVTPNIRPSGLLFGDMPYMDTAARQQMSPEDEMRAMQSVQGTEKVISENKSNEGIFGEILGAMSGVAGKIAEKRGFTDSKTEPQSANQMIPTQVGATPINASNTLPNAPTSISNFAQRQNVGTVGPFDSNNRNIMEVYDPNMDYTKYSPKVSISSMPLGSGVDPSLRQQIPSSEPATFSPEQISTTAPIAPSVDTSFGDANQLGFKQNGAIGIRGIDANQFAKNIDIGKLDYPETEIEADLKDIIDPAANVDYKRLAKALALGFNTLRLNPDQQLSQFLGKSIEQDRQLKIASKTADQIENMGTPQAKLLANAVRNQSITAKDAFTAIYKNKSMPQELLAMMETDPDSFAKLAPFLSGQGYGTMQSSILNNAIKLVDDSRTTAQTSADVFRGVERIQSVIADFAGETGPFAETKKNILQTLAGYGLNFNESYLADAQNLDAASNALVAAQLRLNKGPQTDFDALFTQSFIPSLKNTTTANQKMISYMKSNSLVDMLIDQAVQSVELSTNNPSAYQKSIKDILTLRSNKDIGVIIKVKDADPKTGQEAMFKTFEEFVNDYRNSEPQADPLKILNSWKDITQKARRSLKTKAL